MRGAPICPHHNHIYFSKRALARCTHSPTPQPHLFQQESTCAVHPFAHTTTVLPGSLSLHSPPPPPSSPRTGVQNAPPTSRLYAAHTGPGKTRIVCQASYWDEWSQSASVCTAPPLPPPPQGQECKMHLPPQDCMQRIQGLVKQGLSVRHLIGTSGGGVYRGNSACWQRCVKKQC